MEVARHLPAGTFAEQVDETDTRLWRSVAHYVDEARRLEDYTGVEAVGIDGTGRKGHGYITVVADLVEHDVTDVTPGKDPATVVLLQCLFDRFGSVFPQCGLMVFPGVVIVSR